MIDTNVQGELLKQLEKLSLAKQRQVVAFAESLARDRLLARRGTGYCASRER